VEIINTIFRLGVILAIFGFIWGLFQIAFTILSGGQSRSVLAHYGLKAIQYLFLVQVTFLFCFQTDSDLSLSQNSIVITGLILLFYFVSKLQRNQQKGMLFGFIQNGQKQVVQKFNLAAEIGLVVLALGYFVACIYYPNLGSNTISNWFKESIISIENAAFFGFIFKVIGFFFLLSVFGKIIQSILLLISPRIDNSQNNIDSTEDSTHFDDFEDLTEDQQ
jgi:hypothetical protein|tara:strand:+ start:733 stop:1392 length:660 start_codon:yes stop_codon:yes gene_type:complete